MPSSIGLRRLAPLSILAAVPLVAPPLLLAQDWEPGDTVEVVPGARYAEWGPLVPIMGKGHRAFWLTPIRVPVADLSVLGGGGLTPQRMGGGFMSRTLHSEGVDGRRYVFRSVDKYPAQGLPEDLRGSAVADVIQGQVSALNPVGALVAAPLLEAVGVLHVTPTYYALPDDPRLGEWRETFAGELVLFEERPDDGPDGSPGFAGSRRIRNTDNFRDDLEESPAHRLAEEELLKARLVDLLVGDRDRSVNNWLWARFDEGEGYRWRPVPRDRDQVFVHFDGFARWIVRLFDPRLVRWGDEIPSVEGLSRNAWDIDRNLLVGLDREDWVRIVGEVQARLSDAVIADAVARMPVEHHAFAGAAFADALQQRRDDLLDAAMDLFAIVNGSADVVRTDADELVLLRRRPEGDLQVDVHARPPSGATPVGQPWFSRLFRGEDTDEVRLYMHGGDDLVVVEGEERNGVLVRIIGGGGDDDVLLGEGASHDRIVFYDDDGDAEQVAEAGFDVHDHRPDQPALWPADGTGPGRPDFGGRWTPSGSLGYARGNGLVVALGGQRTRYGFEQDPYRLRYDGSVGYASGPGRPIVDLDYEIRNAFAGVHLFADFLHSPVEVLRYSGYGNESLDTEPTAFYDPDHVRTRLRTGVRVGRRDRLEVEVGARLEVLDSDTTAFSLLAEERPYGSGDFRFASFFGEIHLDGRSKPGRPSRGVQLRAGGSVSPGVGDVTQGRFSEAHAELRGTLAGTENPEPQLALRLGGMKTFGEVPFSEAAFLGGPGSLRGLDVDRYLGDSVAYASLEARVRLFDGSFFVPANYGILGFVDTGRVFLDGEDSDRWHVGWGGGVWASPAISEYPALEDVRAVASVGFADDDYKFYFSLGYSF